MRNRHTVNPKKLYDFLRDPKPTDLVIAVIGHTGAGKSTFTNNLLGKEVAYVGRTLKTATLKFECYEFLHPQHADRRILILDTPGFDDGVLSEREVLEHIASWLAKSYDGKMALAGLIYIFDITYDSYLTTEVRSYDIFEKLCGKDGASKLVLATSKWDKLKDVAEGKEREKELQDEFWHDMIQRGSIVHRLRRSRETEGGSVEESPEASAQKVINSILSQEFQRDMVGKRKNLPNTVSRKVAAEERGSRGLIISKFKHLIMILCSVDI